MHRRLIHTWLEQFVTSDMLTSKYPDIIAEITPVEGARGMSYGGYFFEQPYFVVLNTLKEPTLFRQLLVQWIHSGNPLHNEFFYVRRATSLIIEVVYVIVPVSLGGGKFRVRLGEISHEKMLNSPNFYVEDSGYDVDQLYDVEDWLNEDV